MGMAAVDAGVVGCIRRLFFVCCTLLLFWKRRRRLSLSWSSFCFLVRLGGGETELVSAGVVAVVVFLEKKLKSGAWDVVGEEVM